MEQTIIELCGEIMEIGVKITLFTKHEVFVNFSANVKWLEVNFQENGWGGSGGQEFTERVRLDCTAYGVDPEDTVKRLRGIRDTLRKLYKNGQVNKTYFDYKEEVIKHYKFK